MLVTPLWSIFSCFYFSIFVPFDLAGPRGEFFSRVDAPFSIANPLSPYVLSLVNSTVVFSIYSFLPAYSSGLLH